MAYTSKDQRILEESVQLQLLKESAPHMTLAQISSNIDLMTESEAEYITTVSERILTEFFGGVGNIFKGAKQGAVNAAKGAVDTAKGAASSVAQGAKKVGKGLGAAATQVGQNVKDLYNTGEQESQYGQWKEKAQEYVDELIKMLQDAQQKGLIDFTGDITRVNLKTIVDKLLTAHGAAQGQSAAARDKGIKGGVGSAFKAGFQS